jgi:hypothetical protein
VRDTLKTRQVCTIVLPTKSGQTLRIRIRKASTSEKEVAVLYKLLCLPDQVIKRIRVCTPLAGAQARLNGRV